jgi:hypothetical protein
MTAFPDITLLRSGRRRRRLSVGLPRRASFGHTLAPLLAHLLTSGPAFFSRDIAVVVGVKAGKGFRRPGLHIGDHDRTTIGPVTATLLRHVAAAVAVPATPMSATTVTMCAIPAAFAARRMGTVEFAAADGTIVVGIKAGKAGRIPLCAMSLHGRLPFLGTHHAVVVGINRGQALDALLHELSLADAAIAVCVRTGMALRRSGRSLLRQGDATGSGQSQGGEATQHEGLLHSDQSPETAELAVAVSPS